MRSVGLDLGARHIAFCEIRDGKVIDRAAVQRLEQLRSRLGPNTPPARVAFESSREAWHVHDVLKSWGHAPKLVDTTRVRTIGIGQHGRKNDALDAEVIARAVDADRIPEAHLLSPERRELRELLSVRTALVETRSQYVTTIRGLARAHGTLLASCSTENFAAKFESMCPGEATRALVAPLLAILKTLEVELATVERKLSTMAERDPSIRLCATVPGVGLMVAATFVSVIDDAGRFKNAHAVGAYLGLVPSESTTGGPSKRRLGAITKQGNSRARTMLVQAAWLILRSKDHDNPLRIWATRIAQKCKPVAAVALARKLSGVLWAMCRDGTVFDPRALATESARGVRRRATDTSTQAAALEQAAKKLRRRASRRQNTSEVTAA
jgi:transposase